MDKSRASELGFKNWQGQTLSAVAELLPCEAKHAQHEWQAPPVLPFWRNSSSRTEWTCVLSRKSRGAVSCQIESSCSRVKRESSLSAIARGFPKSDFSKCQNYKRPSRSARYPNEEPKSAQTVDTVSDSKLATLWTCLHHCSSSEAPKQ